MGIVKIDETWRTDKICEALRVGQTIDDAYITAGISRAAFYNWKKQGKLDIKNGDTESPYAVFYTRITEAQTTFENQCLALIMRAGAGIKNRDGSYDVNPQWQVIAWLLERTRGNKYKMKSGVEITGPGGGAVQIGPPSTTGLTEEQVARIQGVMKEISAEVVTDDD